MRTHIQKKVKAPDCAGALVLEGYIRLRKQYQYLLPPLRSGHGIGPGTALFQWIRRAAFIGPAARGRSRGRTLLHFLAGGSAWTDGSFIGRAGRRLVLSRHSESRAEERRNDKSRNCKFGSHKEDLPKALVWVQIFSQTI